jgi:hypothetical protein
MKVNCQAQAVKEDWVKNAGVRRNDANAEVRSENSEVKRENANSEPSAPFAYFWTLTSEF